MTTLAIPDAWSDWQRNFIRASARNRLPQTLMLVGEPREAVEQFARWIAHSLLCERRTDEFTLEAGCGSCPSCRQLHANTHPDLLQARLPEGKSEVPISIFIGEGEKRGGTGLCYELSLRPMSAACRVAIIADADRLSIAAANALLKTLEEPPPDTTIIMLCADPDKILQTIRSRSQIVFLSTWKPQTEVDTEENGELAKLVSNCFSQRDPRWHALSGELSAWLDDFGGDTQQRRENLIVAINAVVQQFRRELQSSFGAGRTHDFAWISEGLQVCFDAETRVNRRVQLNLCLDEFCHRLCRCLRMRKTK